MTTGNLVIGRKINEAVHVGNATVRVVGVKRNGAVRLLITAPRDVHVVREELTTTPGRPAGEGD